MEMLGRTAHPAKMPGSRGRCTFAQHVTHVRIAANTTIGPVIEHWVYLLEHLFRSVFGHSWIRKLLFQQMRPPAFIRRQSPADGIIDPRCHLRGMSGNSGLQPLVLCLAAFTCLHVALATTFQPDRIALRELHNALGEGSSSSCLSNSQWTSQNSDPCDDVWPGIQFRNGSVGCSGSRGQPGRRVVAITLSSCNLGGH